MARHAHLSLSGLIFCSLLAVRSLYGQQPVIHIIQPSDGAVVSSGANLIISAQLAPEFQDGENFNFIQFTVTGTDGNPAFDSGRGDLRSFSSPDLAETTWDPQQAAAGEYTITVFLEDSSGRLFHDQVGIILHKAPEVDVDMVAQQSVPQGVEVTLKATVQDSGPIALVRWDPGDGSPPFASSDLSPFVHTYGALSTTGATYVLTVFVEDAEGVSTTVQRDVIIGHEANVISPTEFTALLAQSDDCGCKSMQIRAEAPPNQNNDDNSKTGIYCSDKELKNLPFGCAKIDNPDPKKDFNACPKARPNAFRCPLGPIDPKLRPGDAVGWAFEVVAHLVGVPYAKTTNNIKKCMEGQAARGTTTRNDRNPPIGNNPAAAETPKPDGADPGLPFPGAPKGKLLNGPKDRYPHDTDWGADGYTGETFSNKRHIEELDTIRWADSPNSRLVNSTMITRKAQFVSWVTGNLGTCWCQIELDVAWTKKDGLVTKTLKKTGGSESCTVVGTPTAAPK